MNKIKKFGQFDKVSESEILREDAQWYIDKGYISDPAIKSKEDLMSKIESEINPAWDKFVAEHKIPMTNPKITTSSSRNTDSMYIELTSDKVPADQLGIFANVLDSCIFVFFSGRQISFSVNTDEFMFKPTIWSSLHLSYGSKKGGSNGMAYHITEEIGSDVWYDIVSGEFRTRQQQAKAEEGNA